MYLTNKPWVNSDVDHHFLCSPQFIVGIHVDHHCVHPQFIGAIHVDHHFLCSPWFIEGIHVDDHCSPTVYW
jgi:hypothetical protein